jgi:hypothetical protein
MRKFAIILVLLVASGVLYYKRDVIFTNWQSYKAPDASFTVELPGDPQVIDKQYSQFPTVHTVNAVVKKDTVYSCLYLTSHELSESDADVLKEVDRDFPPLLGMTPVSDRQFKSDGHPAREIHAHGQDNLGTDLRFLMIGNRLYVLMVTGPDDNRNEGMIHRFFESFKVAA